MNLALRIPVVIDFQGALVAAVLLNTTGEIAILPVIAIRLELCVYRAQTFLLLKHGANSLLQGRPADSTGTVGLNIAGNNIADDFRGPKGSCKLTTDQLAELASGCAELIHYNALHRIPGLDTQPLLHGSERQLGSHHDTDAHYQKQGHNEGVELEAER